jgi:hypothetical protein
MNTTFPDVFSPTACRILIHSSCKALDLTDDGDFEQGAIHVIDVFAATHLGEKM